MTETELIEAHQGFVEGLAHKLKRQLKIRVELDDLMAYGFEGLIQAWRRYDQQSQASFKSFAYYRVRGAMLDGCRKEGWMPRRRKEKVRQIEAINDYQESRHEATHDAPVAKTLSDSISRVTDAVGNAMTILFIESEEMETKLVGEATQSEALELKDDQKRIAQALEQLEENERTIITRYHFREDSLTDIAKDLNLSTSWCSRIHSRALAKMREHLVDSG